MSKGLIEYKVQISQAVLDDLQSRLENARWPDEPENAGWTLGTDLKYMKNLVNYWINRYDWRETENELNHFQQYKAEVDGTNIHFVYEKCINGNGIPLLLLHGWPDSFYRFYKVIDKLTDRFDVVVPSIPGMGFSDKVSLPLDRIADQFHKLMTEMLGYKKFICAGGDGGTLLSLSLSQLHPESLLGYHVTDVGYPDHTTNFSELSDPEKQYAGFIQQWWMKHGAFNMLQSSKPQSIAFAMTDSPVGLAAWIMSFMAGMGIGDKIDTQLGIDSIITNIMIYWVTETAGSSFRLFSTNVSNPPTLKRQNTHVPAAIATECPIPGGVRLPRQWADRQTQNNIVQFSNMQTGAHFAPWEDPDFYVKDLNDFADLLNITL